MTDGFVGLFSVPEAGITNVRVNGGAGSSLSIAASETGLDADTTFHNPSFAQLTLADIDITQGSVNSISIDWREERGSGWAAVDADYDSVNGSGLVWNFGANQVVDYPGGTNTSYAYSNIMAGMPTIEGQSKMYCFRSSFNNGANVAGTITSPDSTERAGTGTQSGDLWTFTRDSGTWTADEMNGRLVKFYDDTVFVCSLVVYDTTATELLCYCPADPEVKFNAGAAIDKAVIPDHTYIYDVGIGGNGEAFNGINDMAEWAEVDDLSANVVGNATYTGPEGINTPAEESLASTSLALTWKNMYDHATDAVREIAVSQDTTDNRLVQGTANITNNQFKLITKYGIFVFISSNGNGPTNNWPMGVTSDTGRTDGTDDNGQWYLSKEVEAPHVAIGDKATISANIEVPPNKQVAVWVGVKTLGMPGWSDIDLITHGLPGDQPATTPGG